MKNLAPHLTRQRLLIEGFYAIQVHEKCIEEYFLKISDYLELKTYHSPIIFSPQGKGSKLNQGYDAFIPLVDSGISLYVWSNASFISIFIYTCKTFNNNKAIEFTKKYFEIEKIAWQAF